MTQQDRRYERRRGEENEIAERNNDKHQGIVRDERGQEQPADKERAQRAVKTDKAG